jgi:hypothetical protein
MADDDVFRAARAQHLAGHLFALLHSEDDGDVVFMALEETVGLVLAEFPDVDRADNLAVLRERLPHIAARADVLALQADAPLSSN